MTNNAKYFSVALTILFIAGALLFVLNLQEQNRQNRPIVGETMHRMHMLGVYLQKYDTKNGRPAASLGEIEQELKDSNIEHMLHFDNFRENRIMDWLYYPTGLKAADGIVILASPISFDMHNSEIKKFGEEKHRVVFLKDHGTSIIPEEDFEQLIRTQQANQ